MRKPRIPLHIAHLVKGETTALVAGGAGFLGSHLCESLLKTCRVTCVDNLRFGKGENIENCHMSEKFTFIEHDITRPITNLVGEKFDYIFHVAGVDEVGRSTKASLDDLLLNTYGTRNLLEKSLRDKAKFLLISTLAERNTMEAVSTAQAKLFSESLTLEYVEKFGLNGRIVRVGHLFGPRMPLDAQNPVSLIVSGLLKNKEVIFAGSGLTRIYPVFIDDAVDILLQTMFSATSTGKTFNLVPSQVLTLFEFCNMLKLTYPQLKVDFGRDGSRIMLLERHDSGHGTPLVVDPRERFEVQFNETVSFFQKRAGFNQIHSPKVVMKRKRGGFPRRFAGALFLLLLIFFSTVLPFLLFVFTSVFGAVKLTESSKALGSGQFAEAVSTASVSRQFFIHAQNFLGMLSYHFVLLRRESDHRGLVLLLKAGEDASSTSAYMASASLSLGNFFRKSVNGESAGAKALLDRAISELGNGSLRMAIVEEELKQARSMPLPDMLLQYTQKSLAVLQNQRETVSLAQTLTPLLPDILDFGDKRTYLVLFQNNMELRPGGGFIGSYGIVIFEDGSLTSFDIYDVYQADGQLRGHIEPPTPIRRYLNQPHWFLRDSNWDPDFQNSALQAAWFLEKEIGTSVDGVIAVDVSFAQFLIEALGPIGLPDYKETITSENLFERAQMHAEADFFPGSREKGDFLGSLARRISDRLVKEENVQWTAVLAAVKKGMSGKHLLFSFKNENLQRIFTLNNWGGTLLTFSEEEGRFSDFRMLSEANLGVNKANFYVSRKVSDDLIIGEQGKVRGKLSIVYKNEAGGEWPGGPASQLGEPYVNYLRTLFPQNTRLIGISIDGKEDGTLEVEETTQSDKSVFGFLLTVASGSTKEIVLSYELAHQYSILKGSTTYAYMFQKQPGTEEDPLSVTIRYPKSLGVKNTNADVFQEKQMITFPTDLSEDRLFEVEFLR